LLNGKNLLPDHKTQLSECEQHHLKSSRVVMAFAFSPVIRLLCLFLLAPAIYFPLWYRHAYTIA